MAITPELEPQQPQQAIPEVPQKEQESPKEVTPVEEKAVTHTPGQLAAQVADDQTSQALPVQDPQVVTVTVPATTQQLDDWSKGSPDNSLTWLAFFWIRMIKKALFHGYRVVTAATG